MELYFFSALLQSDAAILSILGVFIVFKLQSLRNNTYYLRNILVDRATPDGQSGRSAHYLIDIKNFEDYPLERKETDLKLFSCNDFTLKGGCYV